MITMSGCLCQNSDEAITLLFPLCCSFHCIVYTIHMYLHVCVPIYMITMSGCSCLNYDETITLQSVKCVSPVRHDQQNFGQILLRTDTRLIFCNRKLMRTDIFFTRTTKPICNFANSALLFPLRCFFLFVFFHRITFSIALLFTLHYFFYCDIFNK